MATQFDESDFIDSDYESGKASPASVSSSTGAPSGPVARPLTREELDTKVGEAQQKLADLKRAQEELERERAALEEARRRRVELETGREEMLQHLTRGLGLLEEAEFKARRDAEQMGKTMIELREALAKVQAIREETWNPENWQSELTRALTAIENARMEWNRSRLKWPLLEGTSPGATPAKKEAGWDSPWEGRGFLPLCKLGLAVTWPVAVVGLLGLGLLLLRWLR